MFPYCSPTPPAQWRQEVHLASRRWPSSIIFRARLICSADSFRLRPKLARPHGPVRTREKHVRPDPPSWSALARLKRNRPCRSTNGAAFADSRGSRSKSSREIDIWSICYLGFVLPKLTEEGELPPGVHVADWQEFQSRFGGSSFRRVWLSGRLRELLQLAASSGKLRRVFIWGSFVTAKPAPRDLDLLLIMDEDFEVDGVGAAAQAVFDSARAKLLFESDVFWARASIGREILDLWLDTYQTSRSFRKRGIVELELP